MGDDSPDRLREDGKKSECPAPHAKGGKHKVIRMGIRGGRMWSACMYCDLPKELVEKERKGGE